MEFIGFFKQLFIVAFGGFAALVFTFYIIWPKIENYLLRINNINQNKIRMKDNLQLSFSAYERLVLFVYRISPAQVMLRNHERDLSISQFKQKVIADIENEFQHNFTQQLYVSDAAWAAVRDLTSSTIGLLRNASNELPLDATLESYVGVILKHIDDLDVNPYEAAQALLKKDSVL